MTAAGRGGPVIQVWGLTRAYGRHTVLDGVTFEVGRGELIGLVGENGAGKSTLLRCLVGLDGYRGRVEVHGRLGYCPQEPVLADLLTAREQLRLFCAGYRLPAATADRRIAELAQILGFHEALDRRIDRLSGGTRQKVNLSGALLHDPHLLVLDEPYQGFDYDTYQRFWSLAGQLRASGRTVVVVTHLISDVARLDRILQLRGGRVAETVPPGPSPNGAAGYGAGGGAGSDTRARGGEGR